MAVWGPQQALPAGLSTCVTSFLRLLRAAHRLQGSPQGLHWGLPSSSLPTQ